MQSWHPCSAATHAVLVPMQHRHRAIPVPMQCCCPCQAPLQHSYATPLPVQCQHPCNATPVRRQHRQHCNVQPRPSPGPATHAVPLHAALSPLPPPTPPPIGATHCSSSPGMSWSPWCPRSPRGPGSCVARPRCPVGTERGGAAGSGGSGGSGVSRTRSSGGGGPGCPYLAGPLHGSTHPPAACRRSAWRHHAPLCGVQERRDSVRSKGGGVGEGGDGGHALPCPADGNQCWEMAQLPMLPAGRWHRGPIPPTPMHQGRPAGGVGSPWCVYGGVNSLPMVCVWGGQVPMELRAGAGSHSLSGRG